MRKLIYLFTLLSSFSLLAQANQAGVKHRKETVKTVYEKVDRDASFPGGINNFRVIFSKRFNTNNVKANARVIKTVVSFIIERDGTINNIKAVGNNQSFNTEAINTIKRIEIRWKPALSNKQPVRQRYKMPLVMNFE